MDYRVVFNELSKRFFDAGLLTEVYSDDKVCVCNMANSGYVVFFYDYLKKGVEDFIGIRFPGERLEATVNDPNYIAKCFDLTPFNQKRRFVFKLDDECFKAAAEIKRETDIKGPYRNVNLALEDQIRQQQLSKQGASK